MPGARCTRGPVCKMHKEKRTRAYRFSTALNFKEPSLPLIVAQLAAFAKASARQQNKRPSYPAQTGYPVRRGFSFPGPASLEYWITRMRG